ncbi:MAG: hypothetical protein OJF47_003183 [Nitrospira sp.]|jgi:hypothetical protein|nr:MAG: hypothetical protein OJF47_003183 [Nitrospira sp.]
MESILIVERRTTAPDFDMTDNLDYVDTSDYSSQKTQFHLNSEAGCVVPARDRVQETHPSGSAMICLTGDVHHRSYRGVDTPYTEQTDARLALRYCDIAARHHVKVTLFVTGKACLEERETLMDLGRRTHCEIGGHTFCAFRSFRHWLSKSLGGSVLGSVSTQHKDIERTIEAIRDVIGKRITTWRNHAYKHDAHTYPLLGESGIRIVSDRVAANTTAVERVSQELLSLPINTLPAHEHLLHGKYLHEQTHVTQLEGRKTIDEWRADVERQVETIERLGGIATIHASPLCMEVADGMRSFERLCRFLSRYETHWVSEVADSRL